MMAKSAITKSGILRSQPAPRRWICASCSALYDQPLSYCPKDGSVLFTATGLDTDRLGEVVDGKYTLRAILGSGGAGTVYRARQHTTDRQVAVKLLKAEASQDEVTSKRFHQEVRLSSRLAHPNVVSIVDYGEPDKHELYMVMEYLEGRSLREVLNEQGALPVGRVIDLIGQICDGVQHAHEAGLIHRDLKPDNVFVVPGAGARGEFVKVLDFGLAVRGNADRKRLTVVGTVCGTPAYLAPEQAQSLDVDPRSDIYSLGILAYELLTGHVPFFKESPIEVLLDHVHRAPPAMATLAPHAHVPVAVEAVIRLALEKDPSRRPQSMQQLKNMLARTQKTPEERLRSAPTQTSPAVTPLHQTTGAIPIANRHEPDAYTAWTKAKRSAWRWAVGVAFVAIATATLFFYPGSDV